MEPYRGKSMKSIYEDFIILWAIVIRSLTASKHPTHTWMTTLTKQDGCLKLNTLDWKASNLPFSPETVLEMKEDQEISNYSPHIVTVDGM